MKIAGVVKLVDARDSKSRGLRLMRVRFPPPAPSAHVHTTVRSPDLTRSVPRRRDNKRFVFPSNHTHRSGPPAFELPRMVLQSAAPVRPVLTSSRRHPPFLTRSPASARGVGTSRHGSAERGKSGRQTQSPWRCQPHDFRVICLAGGGCFHVTFVNCPAGADTSSGGLNPP